MEEVTGPLHVGMEELMKQYVYGSWIIITQIHINFLINKLLTKPYKDLSTELAFRQPDFG